MIARNVKYDFIAFWNKEDRSGKDYTNRDGKKDGK